MGDNKVAEQGESGWRPIEAAPKDRTRIDLWVKGMRRANCFWVDFIGEQPYWGQVNMPYMESHSPVAGEPTHWMPLPEPPK